MYQDLEPLTQLLRAELTAVHQQFFHMLSLRQWKTEDILRRVTDIDTEDFQNAMQIIELLVSNKQKIELPEHQFSPGWDLPSVLRSEDEIEMQLNDILRSIKVSTPDAIARVNRAAAPRAEYGLWLKSQIEIYSPTGGAPTTRKEMSELVAAIIALVEQPMLHAFYFWRNNRSIEADNFWRISGAAMLYGTALVKRGALNGSILTPSRIPSVQMNEDLNDAFQSDLVLVRNCAKLGRASASAEGDKAVKRTCLRIADDCDLISGMSVDGKFPATFGYSKVFDSFAATLERHLR